MDPEQVQINEYAVPKKSWLKRPLFYILIVVLSIIGYFSYRIGGIYNEIVISNGSWLDNINQSLFGTKQIEIKNSNPMPIPEVNRLDILVMGIRGYDSQDIEQAGGLLTDTIMVVSIDTKTQKAAVISIPRDLYINMLGVNGKINEAYERGLERNMNVDLAKQIVSKITSIYIDKAIVFDFSAFKDIVDTIGGVDIKLDKPFEETQQWGFDFKLPAGNNHLEGEQALYYVRSRYSSSDFDRSRRQQEVIDAIKVKMTQDGYFTNPVKITDLISAIKGDIRTDFQIWDIKDIFTLAQTFSKKGRIKNYVLTSDNLLYESKNPKGEFIILPKGDNYDGIKNLFQNILGQIQTPSPTITK